MHLVRIITTNIGNLIIRSQEAQTLWVPPWSSEWPKHGRLNPVDGQRQRHLPLHLQEQREAGWVLGPTQGQPQDHDLSEDGTGPEKLQPLRGDHEGAPQADLPVQLRHPSQARLFTGAHTPALPPCTGGGPQPAAKPGWAELLRLCGVGLADLVRTLPSAGRVRPGQQLNVTQQSQALSWRAVMSQTREIT